MILLFFLGLIWGRILNQIAYILIYEYAPIAYTSGCSDCHVQFRWWQRLPLISYFMLRGRCPNCDAHLSIFNPMMELFAAFVLCALYYSQASCYLFAYFIFFSALLITFRTDIETMLISRLCTTGLIPVALVLSVVQALPISLFESMFGAVMGYLLLYGIMYIFFLVTKKQGMGLGDLDLLALIGAFTGPMGCWVSLLLGSTLGSITGIMLLLFCKKNKETPITFGPFLAIAAIAYVVWQPHIMACLFYTHL